MMMNRKIQLIIAKVIFREIELYHSSELTDTSSALKSGKTFSAYGYKARNIPRQKMLAAKTIHW